MDTPPTGPGWLRTTWDGGHNSSAGSTVFSHNVVVRQLPGLDPEAWFFDDNDNAAKMRPHTTSKRFGGNVWRRISSTTLAAELLAKATAPPAGREDRDG